MGIVVSLAGEVAAEGAVDAAVEGAAEAAAEAAAEVAGEAAAEAAGEAAAEAAAEGAGEVAADAAAEAAGEAAGEAAADSAIDAAVNRIAGAGADQITRQVVKALIVTGLIEEIFRNVNKIIASATEGVDKIKKLVESLQTATGDAKDNMNTWNKQVTTAMKAGKLKEPVDLPTGGQIGVGTLFSAEMNAKVSEFLSGVQPSMFNMSAVTKAKKPDKAKIEAAAIKVKAAFLKSAAPFLATVKQWDSKEDIIKKEAGVNFNVEQLAAIIDSIKSQEI